MKKIVLAAALFGAAALLAACAQQKSSSSAPAAASPASAAWNTIDAETAKSMMDAGGVTVVDVRTQEEYEAGHIPGAVNVPVESIGDAMPEALPDKAAVLLVYCRSGRRSAAASEKLAGLGYTNVNDFGGINDWPYETVTGSEQG